MTRFYNILLLFLLLTFGAGSTTFSEIILADSAEDEASETDSIKGKKKIPLHNLLTVNELTCEGEDDDSEKQIPETPNNFILNAYQSFKSFCDLKESPTFELIHLHLYSQSVQLLYCSWLV